MSYLTIIALVVFVGYSVYARVQSKNYKPPSSNQQVMSETSIATPDPSPSLSPSSSVSSNIPTPKPSASSKSQINIKVDDVDQNKNRDILIYPNATKIGDNKYETTSSGDEVYNWYKSEMQKRSYQIRNNVKTRANEIFEAVVQGVSTNTALKVTIKQENNNSKTILTLE